MNIMDKETIIELTWHPIFNTKIIKEYCIEMGKNEDIIELFIQVLPVLPSNIIHNIFNIALEYFQIKFNIVIHTSKEGNILNVFTL